MADDAAAGASPKNDPAQIEANEDAETRAARRELKQSSISDSTPLAAAQSSQDDTTTDDKAARPATPDTSTEDASKAADEPELNEQLLSPKKKRAHDQLDGSKGEKETDAASVGSNESGKDRASRLEPEKKRARDEEQAKDVPKTSEKDSTEPATSSSKDQSQTSSSAFAASGFGKLSAGTSPFTSFGGSGAASGGFGSVGGSKLSSFASPAAPAASKPAAQPAAPKLSFGGGSAASPFGGLSPGSNGSAGGSSAFGSAFGTKPMGSFATPGAAPIQSEKPAKPFGAPDSDVEEEEGSDDEEAQDTPDEKEPSETPDRDVEDKKKTKLQKIDVDDGEAGEATVVSVRAKMFYHDKEAGWKERGSGMFKINVPEACVDFDSTGAVVPGSFDASALETDSDAERGSPGNKVPRLLMRQDQTHRVILNTFIVPGMKIQEKASLKSVGILFTAFEGETARPVSITMRMTAANAKLFMREMDNIQRELRGN